jgi:hypothetical protein
MTPRSREGQWTVTVVDGHDTDITFFDSERGAIAYAQEVYEDADDWRTPDGIIVSKVVKVTL